MSIILDLKRTNLVNKCDPHPINDPPELLKFYTRGGYWVAYLKEAIARTDDGFTQVSVFRNGEPLTENTDYTVDNEASTITLIGLNTDINNVTATYTGTGSIIWAEDVNELQTAAQVLATNVLDKNGDTMSGNLNMGGNNITNPGTVDGVDISTHNHANGQGGLIGTAGLESGAVTSSVLADNSVITSKIANLSVTDTKIESVRISKIIGIENQFANRYLTNLENGLANVVCTENPTTTKTATLQKPVVIIDVHRDSTTGDWYRLYSNGEIEMGGLKYVGTDSTATVTFPNNITLTDLNYPIQLTLTAETSEMNNTAAGSVWSRSKTIDGFTIVNDLWAGNVSWEVRGIAQGTASKVLYTNYSIGNGSNVINTLYSYTVPERSVIRTELAGAIGDDDFYARRFGGGKLDNTHIFNIGDVLELKSINRVLNFYNGFSQYEYSIGVALYCNNTCVLAAGGGYSISYDDDTNFIIGGSGYNGGNVFNNDGSPNTQSDRHSGLSFSTNGGAGSSTELTGTCGGSSQPNSQNVITGYGGSGFIHSNFQSDSNVITTGTTTTGNFGNAYVKLSLIQ